MNKKRIVYILHGLSSGGTEAFVINLIKKLNLDNYDITIMLALENDGKLQFREKEVIDLGVTIYRTNDLESIRKKMTHFRKLVKLLNETGPYDVVHSNMDLFNGINLLAAKCAGIRIRICHAHNSQSQYEGKGFKLVIAKVYRFIMKKMIRKYATTLLGCSETANQYFYGDEWKKDNRCHVLYNGIDINSFKKHKERRNIDIPKDRYQLITVGRISNQKDPFFIVEIIQELVNREVDFHFTWVGTGELESAIKDKVASLDINEYVTFLGQRKDIPELLQCHEGFVLPSLFEGLPIALIEAQVAGLKCFVSDNITKEVDAGGCVYISKNDNAKIWADIIIEEMKKGDLQIDCDKLTLFEDTRMIKEMERFYV